MFGKIILGLMLAAVGFLFVWKADWLHQNFGAIEFAEKHLHAEGGSRVMYKILGVIIILIGFLIATDLTDKFIAWAVSSIFGRTYQAPQ
ncbi:MAG: hypothetical protein WC465_02050 [Patescibacteria group bacterium]